MAEGRLCHVCLEICSKYTGSGMTIVPLLNLYNMIFDSRMMSHPLLCVMLLIKVNKYTYLDSDDALAITVLHMADRTSYCTIDYKST